MAVAGLGASISMRTSFPVGLGAGGGAVGMGGGAVGRGAGVVAGGTGGGVVGVVAGVTGPADAAGLADPHADEQSARGIDDGPS